MSAPLSHLDLLEAESIHIFREAAAQFRKPVLMYSIGKDSTVLLHLARKAFFPEKPPFPLLHVDTTWKFREMIASRNKTARAKERVFSFRAAGHRWDPRKQRPEMWRLLNGRLGSGETVRVFPLSNWTEKDVWRYLAREKLDVVPLYFAAERPTVQRNGQLLVVDDERFKLEPGEHVEARRVRFRTLGCYPLTAAVASEASDIEGVVAETLAARTSERVGRLIDHDQSGAMEKKKQEGYF